MRQMIWVTLIVRPNGNHDLLDLYATRQGAEGAITRRAEQVGQEIAWSYRDHSQVDRVATTLTGRLLYIVERHDLNP